MERKEEEYFNGVHYSELPECKALTSCLRELREFEKVHEVEYCSVDTDGTLKMKFGDEWVSMAHHKKVFRENLSEEEVKKYEDIFDRMGQANLAYLKVIRPNRVNK